jgi:ribosome biogenesis GTPase A
VVQVHPIEPTLKAPKSKLLKPEHEKVLSNHAFNFNCRRYTVALVGAPNVGKSSIVRVAGRCTLTLLNPR